MKGERKRKEANGEQRTETATKPENREESEAQRAPMGDAGSSVPLPSVCSSVRAIEIREIGERFVSERSRDFFFVVLVCGCEAHLNENALLNRRTVFKCA